MRAGVNGREDNIRIRTTSSTQWGGENVSAAQKFKIISPASYNPSQTQKIPKVEFLKYQKV